MPQWLCDGATLICTGGTAPSNIKVPSSRSCVLSSSPAATVIDHTSMMNIQPFGNCNMQGNPPPSCVPNTPSPWSSPNSTVMLDNNYALTQGCTLQCAIGGTIMCVDAGQATTVADNIHSGQGGAIHGGQGGSASRAATSSGIPGFENVQFGTHNPAEAYGSNIINAPQQTGFPTVSVANSKQQNKHETKIDKAINTRVSNNGTSSLLKINRFGEYRNFKILEQDAYNYTLNLIRESKNNFRTEGMFYPQLDHTPIKPILFNAVNR